MRRRSRCSGGSSDVKLGVTGSPSSTVFGTMLCVQVKFVVSRHTCQTASKLARAQASYSAT